ncbi:MAG: DNA methyltransferase [Alistipes sp.]
MYKHIIDDSWDYKTANTKEFTHCYHMYPAIMIPQVARRLITDFAPSGKLDLLFDPYMGSGTSLVEASLKGINSIGTDINPLARLISKAKTTHYEVSEIIKVTDEICKQFTSFKTSLVDNTNFDRISNHQFWYSEDNLYKLSYISQIINEYAFLQTIEFFNICLSETVREVSYTRNNEFKRYRIAREKIHSFKPDVFETFKSKLSRNIAGLIKYNNKCANTVKAAVCEFNSTDGIPQNIISDDSVDMIVTSPPYGDSHTTVAYGQFSRWANEWFDFENAKNLDNLLMGGKKSMIEIFETDCIREQINQIKDIDIKRYYEVVAFLNDYYQSIKHIANKVRHGGRVCYVVGNRTVKKVQISLDLFTAETFERFGFRHDITYVRAIPNKRMPSRNSPTNQTGATVNTMNNEYIVILTKL